MIYFDNASTTRIKPKESLDAFLDYVNNIGVSPGRGCYTLGITASRMLYQARKTVANYFGIKDPNVVFTKNSTEAINLFFQGFLKKGDHVVITCYEHNAVFRPLNYLKSNGIIEYSIISREDLDKDPEYIVRKYIKENTVLFVTTLASNVTGRIIFNPMLIEKFKEKHVDIFVDSSQGAGKIEINMEPNKIDYVAFTGHKDLMALDGVGGLCSINALDIKPLIQGGTGIHGEEYTNPKIYPEGLESGTLNMPAIWSLKASLDYLKENKIKINKYEEELTNYLISRLKSIKKVEMYDEGYPRVSTISINIKGFSSNQIVSILDKNNICVRGGIHCSILTHKTLSTESVGAVRISMNYNNTKEEIDYLISVIERI
jgi:cysteine desulfurase / selenocysteine lyase